MRWRRPTGSGPPARSTLISMNNVTAAQLMGVALGSEGRFCGRRPKLTIVSDRSGGARANIAGHAAQQCRPLYLETPSRSPPNWPPGCPFCGPGTRLFGIPAATRAGPVVPHPSTISTPPTGVKTATKGARGHRRDEPRARPARHPPCRGRDRGALPRGSRNRRPPFSADPSQRRRGGRTATGRTRATAWRCRLSRAKSEAHGQLYFLHTTLGTTVRDTTFAARGFEHGHRADFPQECSSRPAPNLKDYINHATELGTCALRLRSKSTRTVFPTCRAIRSRAPATQSARGNRPPAEGPDEETPSTIENEPASFDRSRDRRRDHGAGAARPLANLPFASIATARGLTLQLPAGAKGPAATTIEFTRKFEQVPHLAIMAGRISARQHPPSASNGFTAARRRGRCPRSGNSTGSAPSTRVPPIEPPPCPKSSNILAFRKWTFPPRAARRPLQPGAVAYGLRQGGRLKPR